MPSRVHHQLETYYQQRAERLKALKLDDIFPDDSTVFWSPISTSAPEFVERLIERHLASFETEWQRQLQVPDFCLNAISLRNQVDEQFDYEEELAYACNRLTLAFANKYCEQNGSIDWSKLLRFNSGAD